MNDAISYYARRALGDTAPSVQPPQNLSIVHAQAEVVKQNDSLRKLAGNVPSDGGRKA